MINKIKVMFCALICFMFLNVTAMESVKEALKTANVSCATALLEFIEAAECQIEENTTLSSDQIEQENIKNFLREIFLNEGSLAQDQRGALGELRENFTEHCKKHFANASTSDSCFDEDFDVVIERFINDERIKFEIIDGNTSIDRKYGINGPCIVIKGALDINRDVSQASGVGVKPATWEGGFPVTIRKKVKGKPVSDKGEVSKVIFVLNILNCLLNRGDSVGTFFPAEKR